MGHVCDVHHSRASTQPTGCSGHTIGGQHMISRRYFLSSAAALTVAGAGSASATVGAGLDPNLARPNTTLAQYSGPAPVIPLRDFFRNPEQSNFQVSPDGRSISFQQPYERRMNVFVQPRAGGAAVRVTSETERDIAGYFWKGPGRIVYVKDFKGDENYHVVSVDADGKNLVDLTPFDNVRAEILDGRIDHDDEIIVGLNKRNPEVFDAYRLNLKTRELTLIAENPGNITGWVTDHDGRIRVATSTDGVNTSLLHRADETAPFATVVTTNFK